MKILLNATIDDPSDEKKVIEIKKSARRRSGYVSMSFDGGINFVSVEINKLIKALIAFEE